MPGELLRQAGGHVRTGLYREHQTLDRLTGVTAGPCGVLSGDRPALGRESVLVTAEDRGHETGVVTEHVVAVVTRDVQSHVHIVAPRSDILTSPGNWSRS